MNTRQLTKLLVNDPYVKPLFKGVFAKDELRYFKKGACVINTSPSTEKTGHWTALWIDKDIEFFDSYGHSPPSFIKKIWKKHKWIHNEKQLQSPLSAVCGQYCIYYLLLRARDIDMETIISDFDENVDRNDQYVFDFIDDRYVLDDLTLVDTPGFLSQIARAQKERKDIEQVP